MNDTKRTAQRDELIAAADAAYRNYPAWAGHWDGWLIAAVGRDLWRMGVTLLKRGTYCLVDPAPCGEHEDCRIVYSVLRMIDTHCPAKYLTIEQ